ncbi:MAG: glycosyltransferase family 2 protein [Xanthobacteraceae bacterium]
MKLSIVTTLYKSAGTINEFYRRAVAAAEPLGCDIELIMVNDGSPDATLDLALALQRSDPRVIVVDLSRNFGHHKALMTGLSYARGDLVFLIDSDLQEDPELLPAFNERLAAGDCDVVYGYQEKRSGGVFERVTGGLYYSLLKLLSDNPIPRNILTARLMTKRYVRALLRFRDREFLISQLWKLSGFDQIGVPAIKRPATTRTYTLRLRAEYFIRHLTTSSTRLLYVIFYFGLIMLVLAAAVICWFLLRYAFAGVGVSGFTSLIVSIWFFGGLMVLILGVQGIYIANILSESKRRPYAVVRKVYRDGGVATPSPDAIVSPLPGA